MIRIFKLSIFCGKRDHFTGCAPSGLFPADRIFVRTKGIPGTSLQTGFPRVTARVDGTQPVAVPFEVEVFGFELPEKMTLQTSFGYTQGRVFAYHRVKTANERPDRSP